VEWFLIAIHIIALNAGSATSLLTTPALDGSKIQSELLISYFTGLTIRRYGNGQAWHPKLRRFTGYWVEYMRCFQGLESGSPQYVQCRMNLRVGNFRTGTKGSL
jgi:hypothetical protein